ncbi:sigma-54 factor interaction domain-containing protein [Flavonifractor plautii]|nr:sigma-54 factor interaction domain-containing protein [Flavonifractor plautii]
MLIFGESGTGKELFAQSIHNASRRRQSPFVAVNCAAIPDTLIESELLVMKRGFYWGTQRGKQGLFQTADNGTIFLDEIGDIPSLFKVAFYGFWKSGK